MEIWGYQTDPVGITVGIVVSLVSLLAGWFVSWYYYRKPEWVATAAETSRLDGYLKGPVAQQAESLVSRSLYAHLPSVTATTFSKVWIRRIVVGLPEQGRFDESTLCRQTRLLIEQILIECVQPTGAPLEPATWPGQTWEQHSASLEGSYLLAIRRLSSEAPHVVATSFALHRLADNTPPVSNYFQALAELAKAPDSVLGPSDRFISKVSIENGFVAPLSLLRGLLTQMESDWPLLLAQYGRSIKVFPLSADRAERQPQHVLEHLQAFQFYCWLLWGPSVPRCGCEAWRGSHVLQYGYGDENNSLHLVLDDPKIINESMREIESAMLESGRPHPLAVQVKLTATPMWGPNLASGIELPWIFDPLEQASSTKSEGLLLRCVSPVDAQNIRPDQKLLYYSAYVWMMFEICDPHRRLGPRRKASWQYCLPLFEHGNIADGMTLLFAKRALVRKALAMIESIEDSFTPQDGGAPEVYLRYMCSIDDPGEPCRELLSPVDVELLPDALPTLLREAVDGPRRARLFEEPSPLSVDMMLDTSCHLPHVVELFYQSLSTRT